MLSIFIFLIYVSIFENQTRAGKKRVLWYSYHFVKEEKGKEKTCEEIGESMENSKLFTFIFLVLFVLALLYVSSQFFHLQQLISFLGIHFLIPQAIIIPVLFLVIFSVYWSLIIVFVACYVRTHWIH